MVQTILIKRSFTTGAEPASLAPGEVAINVTDKKVWVGDAASAPVLINDKGEFASYLPLAGGEMTGSIVGPVDTETLTWASGPFNAAVSSDGTKVVLSVNDGDATFTLQVDKIVASRPIELPLYALEDNHAARVDYVNQRIAALGIPTPQYDKLGGVYAAEAPTGQAQYGISTSGAPIFKEIAVPYPAPDRLGGVNSGVATNLQTMNGIDTDGKPIFGDIPYPSGSHPGGVLATPGVVGYALHSINPNGTVGYIEIPPASTPYVLPTASATVLGGVKVGTGLAVDANGVLSSSGVTGAYLPLAGGTMTGTINLPDSINALQTASGFNIIGNAAGMYVRSGTTNLWSYGVSALTAYKPIALPADPTSPLHAATKQYVDSKSSTYTLPTASATVLGGVKVGTGLAVDANGVLSTSGTVTGFLPLAGGTMTGTINVPAGKDAVRTVNGFSLYDNNVSFLIRKDDVTIAAFQSTLHTSTVPIKLPADPTDPLHAATKQYVDSKSSTYTLPTASATVLGGIKIGAGLAIDAGGVVSASSSVTNPVAGSQSGLTLWVGTQAQYDAIATKDAKTVYNITA
jgi:serine acetyltransferase